MEKILSICIPVYNGGQTAYQNITEILTYENDDIEVIVSDNASTDNTLELLQQIEDDRLKIVTHKENSGPFLNWYHALMAGTAKYVMLHQDNDRIIVKNMHQYLEFLKSVQYDVIRNCYGFLESREITVSQVQYYNAIYSHASYVMYRREALHAIKPLKCSFNRYYMSHPYILWDTQILMNYPLETKKAFLNGDIKITYTPKAYQNQQSRTRQFAANGHPSYSYENITYKFINYIKVLRYLYPKDYEYSRLICNAYRANLYWATTHFYLIMNRPEEKWMKRRYGLDQLDEKQIDYVNLSNDFFRMIVPRLRMQTSICKAVTTFRLKLITVYNKNSFLLYVFNDKIVAGQRWLRRWMDTLLKIYVEKVCR